MKTKFREPPKYDLQGSIEVFMNDRRYYAWLDTELVGPIPARAGQPRQRRAAALQAGAYPRSRGATASKAAGGGLIGGLSPLARGNPTRNIHKLNADGPIPARAGQPTLPPQ